MTLWEQALNENQYLRPRLRMAGELVQHLRVPRQKFWRGVSAQRFERLQDPLNVFGSGLWTNQDGDLLAAVFVQEGLAPAEGIAASETQYGPLLSSDASGHGQQLMFVGLPPPQPQNVEANETVVIGSLRGRLGLPIRCANGSSGFTTAGHNAPNTPATVRDDDGQRIGKVVVSFNLNNRPAMAPTADVAAVELDGPDPDNNGRFRIGTCRPLDVVRFRGGVRSIVRGLSPNFALRPSVASWGEVAITSKAISDRGDSGGVVEREDGLVVGHIVAGQQQAYTLVQDAHYILAAVSASLR